MIDFRKPIPAETKMKVRIRSGGKCEDCRASSPDLELHHLTYEGPGQGKYQQDIFGFEEPHDLALLCRVCHRKRHLTPAGDFMGDIDQVRGEWDYFWHMADKDD